MLNQGFIDLHIKFNSDVEESELIKILQEIFRLNYTSIAISYNISEEITEANQLRKYFDTIKSVRGKLVENKLAVKVYRRLNVISNNASFIKKMLRKYRRIFDIIGVNPCSSLSTARFAARDRRVDMIFFSSRYLLKFFDETQAKIMSSTGVFLEIPFNIMFRGRNIALSFKAIRKAIAIAKRYNVPMVLSSASYSLFNLISPLQLTSLLTTLGLNSEEAMLCITANPKFIIERNRHRKSRDHVAPGVDIIRGAP